MEVLLVVFERVPLLGELEAALDVGGPGEGRVGADHSRPLLCAVLDETGPEAPTLCKGWRTLDLAAHLVLRSGRDPRILIAFPAGNSAVGLWFSRLQKAANWEVTREPQPVVLADAKGRFLYGISTQARVGARELTIVQAVLSNVRVLRDYQAVGTVPAGITADPVTQGQSITWARDRIDGALGRPREERMGA